MVADALIAEGMMVWLTGQEGLTSLMSCKHETGTCVH